jgi:hypothetical protein
MRHLVLHVLGSLWIGMMFIGPLICALNVYIG